MGPIVIVDYGAGNLRSVQKAFEHLGHRAEFASDPGALDGAPAIVFPGQGASPPAMTPKRSASWRGNGFKCPWAGVWSSLGAMSSASAIWAI